MFYILTRSLFEQFFLNTLYDMLFLFHLNSRFYFSGVILTLNIQFYSTLGGLNRFIIQVKYHKVIIVNVKILVFFFNRSYVDELKKIDFFEHFIFMLIFHIEYSEFIVFVRSSIHKITLIHLFYQISNQAFFNLEHSFIKDIFNNLRLLF